MFTKSIVQNANYVSERLFVNMADINDCVNCAGVQASASIIKIVAFASLARVPDYANINVSNAIVQFATQITILYMLSDPDWRHLFGMGANPHY